MKILSTSDDGARLSRKDKNEPNVFTLYLSLDVFPIASHNKHLRNNEPELHSTSHAFKA